MEPKTLDQRLEKCKSLKRIEGVEAVREFLIKREEARKKAGASDEVRFIKTPDGSREYIARNTPTGFRQKKLQITLDQAKKYASAAGVNWETGFEQPDLRVLAWRMSDERVDRHGDIVRQNFDWSDFDKNPVLLNCHDWGSKGLIGNIIFHETVRVVEDGYSGPATNGLCLFAPMGVDAEADRLYRLARANLARAGSIGFFPSIIIYIQDEAERTELGLGRWGVIYDKSSMAEFSLCPIPANAGALQNALKKMLAHKTISAADAPTLRNLFSQPECVKEIDAIFAPDGKGGKQEPPAVPPSEPKAAKKLSPDDRIALLEKQNDELATMLAELTKNVTVMGAVVAGAVSCIRSGMEDLYSNQQEFGGSPMDKNKDGKGKEKPEAKSDLDELDDLETLGSDAPLNGGGKDGTDGSEGAESDDEFDLDDLESDDEGEPSDKDATDEFDLDDLGEASDDADSDE